MSTSAVRTNAEQPTGLRDLRDTARSLSVGLFWGGGMLVILALWLSASEPEASRLVPGLCGALGLAAMALGCVPAVTLWQQRSPEEQVARLTGQRRVFGLILLASGVLLLVLALALGLTRKGDGTLSLNYGAFGEAAGLLLVALAALGIGWHLRRPAGADATPILEWARSRLPLLNLALVILGLMLLVGFGVLAYNSYDTALGTRWLPELFGLLFLTLLCFGAAIWSGVVPADQRDLSFIRMFILVVGGLAGLILFVMALGRAWAWRQDIWGGMSAWQGENAWHLWLVIYVQLFALALVFGSLSLARTDVRANVSLRRLLFGYNDLFLGLLVLQLLIVANVLIYALLPYSFQWSELRGVYALSPATKNVLARLKKETHVFVLMPSGTMLAGDLRSLLDNAQAETNLLQVKYLSPDRDAADYNRLRELFPKVLPDAKTARFGDSGQGMLIVYGAMPEDSKHSVKHTFIPDRKLVEQKPPAHQGERPKRLFTGETEFLRELTFLVQNQVKRKVYFLQGAGTPDLAEQTDRGQRRDMSQGFGQIGIGILGDKLRKENFEIQGLSFDAKLPGGKQENLVFAEPTGADKKKEVPEDTHALVIAGVSQALSAEVVDAVSRFLDRGGKLLVFLDVIATDDYSALVNTGLEPLLKRHGVDVQPGFPLRVFNPNGPRDDPLMLISTTAREETNALARAFSGEIFVLRRGARLLGSAEAARFKVEPVLQLPYSPRQGLANLVETTPSALRDAFGFEMKLWASDNIRKQVKDDPLTVVMAVSERDGDKPRLLVFGDTECITNLELSRPGQDNFSLVLAGLEWMSERESVIGPRPKETGVYSLGPTAEPVRMALLPGWLMLLALLGLGTGIWLVRRR